MTVQIDRTPVVDPFKIYKLFSRSGDTGVEMLPVPGHSAGKISGAAGQ